MDKDAFHRTTRRTLKQLAVELGLKPGTFDVRSNKGGPAVQGEVMLHTDTFYLQVGGLDQETVLYRTCTSRKDYRGGANNYMTTATLCDLSRAAQLIRTLTQPLPEVRQRVQHCEGGRKMNVTEYVVDYGRVQWGERGRATHPDVPADFDFHSGTIRDGRHTATFSKVEALP